MKKTWYIWLSYLAGLILVFGSCLQVTFSPQEHYEQKWLKSDLIHKCTWQILVFQIRVIILNVPSVVLYELFGKNYTQFHSIIYGMHIVVFYLSGVYATYKFVKWRKKNLAFLLNSKMGE